MGRVHLVSNTADVREAYHRKEFVRSDFVAQIGGKGLIFSDGDTWREHRRIAQPFFHERVMDRYLPGMNDAVDGFIERLGSHADSGSPVDIIDEAVRFTVRTLYASVFNVELPADHGLGILLTSFFDAVGEVTLALYSPDTIVPSDALQKFVEIRTLMYEEVDRLLDERGPGGESADDMIGAMGRSMSREALRDEIITFFLAGGETTSNLLTWLCLLLADHPDELHRVQREVDDAAGNASDEFASITSMPHLQATVNETMRLFPPVWLTSRQAVSDTEINGRAMAANDWILVCIYLLHRNPSLWEDPHRFRPSRFTDSSTTIDRYAFVPFGEGRHLCIGKHFGIMEAMLGASRALQGFTFERAVESPLDPWPGLTLKPRGRAMMHVRTR